MGEAEKPKPPRIQAVFQRFVGHEDAEAAPEPRGARGSDPAGSGTVPARPRSSGQERERENVCAPENPAPKRLLGRNLFPRNKDYFRIPNEVRALVLSPHLRLNK